MDYTTTGTSARVREWQYLTSKDFEAVDRERTVVMVTCSPLEVHGPHLPVACDNHEAEALALRTMELLCERLPRIEFLHLPPIYVAADVVPRSGSLAFRSSTIVRVLEDLGRTLGKQGFRHVWVSSFHGGPRHFVPIELAAHRSNRHHGTKMVSIFSLLIKKLTGGGSDLSTVLDGIGGLTRADLDGDSHGGAIETSMMLHLLGRYVDPVFRTLDQRTVNLDLERRGERPLEHGRISSLLRGFRHKIGYFSRETYAGKPSIASPEIGKAVIDVLAGHTAEALAEVYEGTLSADECHSPIWPVRWLFTSELVGRAFERAVGYENRIF